MAEVPFRVKDVTASDEVKVSSNKLFINNVAVTSSAADLNQLNGITLGTAAQANTGDFATAAQGATADTALQTATVDGTTITGDGTVGNPLVANIGGGNTLNDTYYRFETSTALTPGSGKVQFNNATFSSVTQIGFNRVNKNGVDIGVILNTFIDASYQVYFQQKDDASKGVLFNITSGATLVGDVYTFDVTHLQTTTQMSNGKDCFVLFAYREEQGLAIGDTVTGATQGSVFFAGSSGVLAQDNAKLFFDDSTDRLGVGTNNPSVLLHIQENSLDELLRIESTDATPGSNSAPDIVIKSAKQTTNDYLGSLWWYANDDGGNAEAYGRIGMILDDPSDGVESGAMFIQSDVEGTLRTMLYLEGYTTGGAGQIVTNYNAKNINFRTLNLGTSGGGPGGYGIAHNASNGRVGIGTSSPSSLLHLVGIDDSNPELRISRSGVSTQYLSMQNEDASGGFLSSQSSEANKKPLYLESIHNSGGSAAGDNSIIFRTGASSGPTTRMTLSDTSSSVSIESGTNLQVDDYIRIGFTSGPTETDYALSVSKAKESVSGGLFSSSIGESAITNDNAGWWLTANGMNTSSKYTPAIKFGSNDSAFTTDSPKWLAGIVGRAGETYSDDTTGGMALDFLTFPDGGGASGGPTTRMTIHENGFVGIGTTTPAEELHIVGASDPKIRITESGENGYTEITAFADSYGAFKIINSTADESTIMDLSAESAGTGAQTIRLFRTANSSGSARFQILSPGTTSTTFNVDAATGKVTQDFAKDGVITSDANGALQLASNLADVAYLQTVAIGSGLSGDGTAGNPLVATGGGGGVTSVATSAPITGGTITGTGTIGITQASGSADGYLSSANWTTFNNKLAAGDNVSALANDANYINPTQIGAFAPPVATPVAAAFADSPTGGPLNPAGWLQIDVGLGPMFVPVYQ